MDEKPGDGTTRTPVIPETDCMAGFAKGKEIFWGRPTVAARSTSQA